MASKKLINNQIVELKAYVSSQGLKWTHQREIIAGQFFSKPHRHYRLEELLDISRQKDATISYATVYRTLMMLTKSGMASQRQFGKGQSLFEATNADHHDHLICTTCGKIVEFENEMIEKLQEKIVKKAGFKLTHHKMELYGLCARCQ